MANNNGWEKLATYVPKPHNRSYTDENGQTWEYSSYPGTPAPNSRNPAADQQARDARYRSQLGWDTTRKYPMPSGTNQWRGQDVSGGYQGISANRSLYDANMAGRSQTPYQAALAQADDRAIIEAMAQRDDQWRQSMDRYNAARQQYQPSQGWERNPNWDGGSQQQREDQWRQAQNAQSWTDYQMYPGRSRQAQNAQTGMWGGRGGSPLPVNQQARTWGGRGGAPLPINQQAQYTPYQRTLDDYDATRYVAQSQSRNPYMQQGRSLQQNYTGLGNTSPLKAQISQRQSTQQPNQQLAQQQANDRAWAYQAARNAAAEQQRQTDWNQYWDYTKRRR